MYQLFKNIFENFESGKTFRVIKNIKKGADIKVILLSNFSSIISSLCDDDFEIGGVNGDMMGYNSTIGDDDSIYYIKQVTAATIALPF